MAGGHWIMVEGADGFRFRAWREEAKGEIRGSLILIQEIFGVTPHIRELCAGFAAEGYVTVAPSLYDRIEPCFEAANDEAGITRALAIRDRHTMAQSMADVARVAEALRAEASRPLYVTGYCYGGAVAYVAAARIPGLAAAVGYYGRLIHEHRHETPLCPVMLHFGRTDASIPMTWVEAIAEAQPAAVVHVYDAGHGFNSDRRSDYHAPSARLARERTLAFFAAHGA